MLIETQDVAGINSSPEAARRRSGVSVAAAWSRTLLRSLDADSSRHVLDAIVGAETRCTDSHADGGVATLGRLVKCAERQMRRASHRARRGAPIAELERAESVHHALLLQLEKCSRGDMSSLVCSVSCAPSPARRLTSQPGRRFRPGRPWRGIRCVRSGHVGAAERAPVCTARNVSSVFSSRPDGAADASQPRHGYHVRVLQTSGPRGGLAAATARVS